jgi:hypothetical protein
MINTTVCTYVTCDGCGCEAGAGESPPHFETAELARNDACNISDEFWTNGTVDLCFECLNLPHPAVPFPSMAGAHCQRCGVASDDATVHGSQYPVVPERIGATR